MLDILDNVKLTLCTTSTVSRGVFKNIEFNAVFVDEAAQVRVCRRGFDPRHCFLSGCLSLTPDTVLCPAVCLAGEGERLLAGGFG